MLKKLFLVSIMILVSNSSTLKAEIALQYGSGNGKFAYINAKTNPGEDIPVPIGPQSFRAVENGFWLLDTVGNKLVKVDLKGKLLLEITYAEPEEKILAEDFFVVNKKDGSLDSIWIIDGYNIRLLQILPDGKIGKTIESSKMIQPMEIEIDSNGDFMISDYGMQKIFVLSQDGRHVSEIEYQWSGFVPGTQAGTIYRLHFDHQSQQLSLIRQTYDNKVLANIPLNLSEHYNSHIWWVDEDANEILITYKLKDTEPGKKCFAVVGLDGKIKSQGLFNVSIAPTRKLVRDENGKTWLIDADYGKAPDGFLKIIDMFKN